MRFITFLLILTLLAVSPLHASQSVILDAEGYACMGDDKSRKQTEDVAVKDAKRKASEAAVTYIQAETHVKDAMLEKDLLSAYASAQVKLLKEYLKEWYKDTGSGDCYRVKLSVEVVPDEKTMEGLAKKNQQVLQDDPAGPLNVKVWTDKQAYANGEKMRVYLKGNKPFYGRVVYSQTDGSLVQLLPNPYRDQNYFNGGVVYELPSGDDRYDLEVAAPFGAESITAYASTVPTGSLEVKPSGGIFIIATKSADISIATRGIKLVQKGEGSGKQVAAEFAESVANVTTGK